MAVGGGVTLPFPPYQAAIVDPNGLMSSQWQQWFQQMYVRIGLSIAVPNIGAVQKAVPLVALYVGSNNTTVYTSPVGQNTIIDSFTATNTDSAAQLITVYLVPLNGVPTDPPATTANLSVNAIVPQGATISLPAPLGQVIGGLGFISCKSSKANAISVAISGRVVS